MVRSERSDSISMRRLSFLACASALLVGVAGVLGGVSGVGVVVGGGVGLWAIAGALMRESGMVSAAIRAARRRVRLDKPDAVRDGFT